MIDAITRFLQIRRRFARFWIQANHNPRGCLYLADSPDLRVAERSVRPAPPQPVRKELHIDAFDISLDQPDATRAGVAECYCNSQGCPPNSRCESSRPIPPQCPGQQNRETPEECIIFIRVNAGGE